MNGRGGWRLRTARHNPVQFGTTVDATMTAFPLLVRRVRVRFLPEPIIGSGCDGKRKSGHRPPVQ